MATVTKTFSFASNAEGWASTGGTADTTLAWASTGGNTGGCISSRIFGRNKSADPLWFYAGTWESMGVPTGATVTDIKLLGFDWRCSEWNVGNTATQIRASLLMNSDATVQIAQLSTDEPTVSGTTTYAAITGTIQSVGASYQASNTTVRLRFDIYLRSANNNSAAVTLLMDNFSVEITYTPANTNVTPLTGETTATGYAPTVTIAAKPDIDVSPSTGETTATGYAPTISVTNNIFISPPTGETVATGYVPTVTIAEVPTFLTTVKSLTYSIDGSPWARVVAKQTIDPDTLEYSLDGSPWWGHGKGSTLSWTTKSMKWHNGSTWVAKPLKAYIGGSWQTKSLKKY